MLLTTRSSAASTDVLQELGPLAAGVTFVECDFAGPKPFDPLRDHADRITHLVHAAAAIRFNIDRDLAQQVNVDGTRAALDFARTCPNLTAFGHVSSVYSTGLRAGPISEQRYDDSAGMAATAVNPEVAATISRIMEDEKWHVQWVRDALVGMEERYGKEHVAETLTRYRDADREVYAQTITEYEARLGFLTKPELSHTELEERR